MHASAFSFDNKYVAIGGINKKLVLYDLTTYKEKFSTSHSDVVISCAFSYDNQYVASGGRDEKLLVRSLQTGVRLFLLCICACMCGILLLLQLHIIYIPCHYYSQLATLVTCSFFH